MGRKKTSKVEGVVAMIIMAKQATGHLFLMMSQWPQQAWELLSNLLDRKGTWILRRSNTGAQAWFISDTKIITLKTRAETTRKTTEREEEVVVIEVTLVRLRLSPRKRVTNLQSTLSTLMTVAGPCRARKHLDI